MPRPKSDIPMTSHAIRLFEGDLAALQGLYPKLGATKAIRLLVRNHIKQIRKTAEPLEIILPDNIEELLND